jgi:hydrophobe/amphiphile efflux-1 (HAE1) family protein
LTLSPALAAILLRRKAEGAAYDEVLPPAGFPLVGGLLGGLLGYEYLAPSLERAYEARLALSPWTVPVATAVTAAIAAWIFRRPLNHILARLFRLFNVGFDHSTNVYARSVGGLLRVSVLVLVVYGGLLLLTWWGFTKSPSGFIPAQDKGYLLVNVQLPDAASVERTERVMHRIEELAHKNPGVKNTVAIAGQSILLGANAPNFGAMYVMLDDFHRRAARGLSGEIIAAGLQADFQQEIKDGLVNVLGAPPIDGLGTAGGFKIIVEDRGDNGLKALQAVGETIVDDGSRIPSLAGLFSSFRADTPWIFLDIDRTQAKVQGVSMAEVFATLQDYQGSFYVNDFNRNGRTWQVNVQADARYRKEVDDLKQLKVRNDRAGMVPLATVSSPRWISGPVMIQRYNMYIAAPINGAPAPGVSSGEAIRLMEDSARRQLQQVHAMSCDWTELAKLQLETGNTAMLVFVLAVVLVFLVLAAQYESWSLPLAVILVVPMCLLCSIAGVAVARMDVNIFTQVGFVVLVGLACKNAILIVEYAKAQREGGADSYGATLAACHLRLRPIMMTSFAFILGVVPLVVAVGAGAEMRRTLGTAVFSGMLGVTFFGIFLTPVFYYVIQRASEWRRASDE